MATARTLAEARQLVEFYRRGWFPMAGGPGEDIQLLNPDPRAIIPLEGPGPLGGLHVPRSLARQVRRGGLVVTADAATMDVVHECAAPREGRGETWIDERMLGLYTSLHAAGVLHSIEAWRLDADGSRRLVGGVFGLAIGGLFAAESMFTAFESGVRGASSVCLVHLVAHLRRRGFELLDLQLANPHTERFGCVEIPRSEYLTRLAGVVDAAVDFGGFDPDAAGRALGPTPGQRARSG